MPYGLVLLVAAGVLVTRHVWDDRASPRCKWTVVGVTVVSALPFPWPLIATVVQLSVCVYVIFHRIVADGLAELGD